MLEADVLVVSFESAERVRWYLEDVDYGWPVASDPSRELYRAYGLGRGGFAKVWLSRATVLFYLRSALRGRVPHRPQADTLQLGGDFVIDRAGVVRFAHRSTEPADRPPPTAIVAVLQQLR